MMVYIWIRCTGTVMYRVDLVDHTSSTGTGSQYPIRLTVIARHMTNSMRQCVLSRLRTVEYSRVSLQDAAERCIARPAHVAPLCVCFCVKLQEGHEGVRIFAWLCHASSRPRRLKAQAQSSLPSPALGHAPRRHHQGA